MNPGSGRRHLSGAITLGAVVLAAALAPGIALGGPLSRDGMWIWYVSDSGGSAAAIANKARAHNIRLVLIKSSDGVTSWSQFNRGLVAGLKDRGMKVCAWQFVYGNKPREEARLGAAAAGKGAECLIVDAESHYEGRYPAADRFVRTLRRRVGREYPVGLTSFPWVDYHPAFPYSVFLGRAGAQFNLPQVYWRAIGASVDQTMAHTYRWNRPYDRPIRPLGQTWQNPPGREIRRFRRLAAGYGSRAVSWWSWQETNSSEWRRVGTPISPPYPDPKRNYPRLARGSRGDIVVLLQELLLTSGRQLRVDGLFGAKTETALRRFQGRHGLETSGVANGPTWRALRQYRPKRVRWSQRGNPAFTKARALRPAIPAALEVPSTPGRP